MTLGIVATRGSVSEGQNDPSARVYGCFATFARDDITSLRVVWSHWWGSPAHAPAGNLTIMGAEIEYPTGVFTPITFSGGSASVVTGPLTNVTSDPVSVAIPNGALFHVRALTDGSCHQSRTGNATLGEGSIYPATGLTLVTARAAAFNANWTFTPSVIVGETSKPSAIILGDSRPSGLGDSYQRADGSYGTAGGAMNAYGWGQMVQWGGKASDYLSSVGAIQDELVSYATDVVCELFVNDLWAGGSGGVTAAAALATVAAIRARYATKRFHLCTGEPLTPGSGNFWEDLAGQAPFYNDAQLQIYNAAVLGNPMGYDPPFDFAAVVQAPGAPSKWNFDGTAYKYTIDGLHESPFGYGLFASAGFTLAPIGTVPLAPSGLSLHVVGATSVSASWTDNATDETGYHVYYSSTGIKPGSPQVTLAANSTTTTVTGLTSGLTYTFWVEAFNAIGSSASITGSILALIVPQFQMQGRSVATNALVAWIANSPDWSGAHAPEAVADSVLYARTRVR